MPPGGRRKCARRAPRRQILGHAFGHEDNDVIADVHAESLIDDVQAVDVQIEDDVSSAVLDAPIKAKAWRSNAWRVMRPVPESYCARMILVARLASTSAMRVCATSKSGALGGLNIASTPMTRSERWRTGQARILYGAATSVATFEIWLTTNVRCCSCIQAIR